MNCGSDLSAFSAHYVYCQGDWLADIDDEIFRYDNFTTNLRRKLGSIKSVPESKRQQQLPYWGYDCRVHGFRQVMAFGDNDLTIAEWLSNLHDCVQGRSATEEVIGSHKDRGS